MNQPEYSNTVGDVVAFRSAITIDPKFKIAKRVYRVGQIMSYAPHTETEESKKVVRTRDGTEFTLTDKEGIRWSYAQWDNREYPAQMQPGIQAVIVNH
jgi:hypothetical protein